MPPLVGAPPNIQAACKLPGWPPDGALLDTAVRAGGNLLLRCCASHTVECYAGVPEPLAWEFGGESLKKPLFTPDRTLQHNHLDKTTQEPEAD